MLPRSIDARIDVCRCLDVVDECELVSKRLPGVFADFVGNDGIGDHVSPHLARTRAASSGIRSPDAMAAFKNNVR